MKSIIVILVAVLALYGTAIRSEGQSVNLTPEGELQEKPPIPPDSSPFIGALEKRKQDLDRKSEELDQESQKLQALKSEINALMQKYSAEKEADRKAKSADNIDARQLEHLTKVYEAMPPKDGADRIQQINEGLALKLLSNMKPKLAARILNEMKPIRAARLTEKLSHTSPPVAAATP